MKLTKSIVIFIVLSLILVTTSFAVWGQAQHPSQTPGSARQIAGLLHCMEEYKSMDKKGDGLVTFQEFMSIPHPEGDPKFIFKSLDTNGDGYLTLDEYCVQPEKKRINSQY